MCAGWADGATMIGALDQTEIFPIPVGPEAPSLLTDDDPLAWHDLPPLDRRTVRAYAEKFSWRASAEEFVRNLQPYPEPQKTRFWRRLRRLARLRRRPAA